MIIIIVTIILNLTKSEAAIYIQQVNKEKREQRQVN